MYNNQYSRGFGAVASAAIQAGLSADTAQQFAQILMQTSGNSSAVASLPGITPEIINAGSVARLDSIALAYRYIWITGIPFMLMATIGVFNSYVETSNVAIELTLVKHPISLLITKKNSTIVLILLFLANYRCEDYNTTLWRVNTYNIIPTSLIPLQDNNALPHVAKHECEHSVFALSHFVSCATTVDTLPIF